MFSNLFIVWYKCLSEYISTENIKCSWLVGSNMDISHGMFKNATGHMDFKTDGQSSCYQGDTTHTDTEEYIPNDTFNNTDWPYRVPFAHGNVSIAPGLSDDKLVQSVNDLLHSELISLQGKDNIGKEFISVTDAELFYN